MDNATLIATLVGAGGLGAALLELVRGFSRWSNGTAAREKSRNADLVTQRNDAWEERDRQSDRADKLQQRADTEARNRNRAQDYAARLRRMLIEAGVESTMIPADPPYVKHEED